MLSEIILGVGLALIQLMATNDLLHVSVGHEKSGVPAREIHLHVESGNLDHKVLKALTVLQEKIEPLLEFKLVIGLAVGFKPIMRVAIGRNNLCSCFLGQAVRNQAKIPLLGVVPFKLLVGMEVNGIY